MGLRQHAKGTNGSGERWKGNGVSGLVREENKGAAELEPATHSRKRDMNSEMCRSNVSVLEVRIAAKGVHVRSNAAMVGKATPRNGFLPKPGEKEFEIERSGPKETNLFDNLSLISRVG